MENLFLKNKNALVTGAGTGIGRAIAKRLAAEGALTAVHYSKSKKEAENVVAEIEQAGGKAFTVQADVRSVAAIQEMMSQLIQEFANRTDDARLDILVNNAGVPSFSNSIEETTEAEFDNLFAVNTKGLFFVTQAALKYIPKGGHIINISSLTTRGASPARAAYAASKAAVNSLSLSMAKDLGEKKISVNAILPGFTETNLTKELVENVEIKKSLVATTAFGRVGQPEDIANAVALFLSPDAGWITGQLIDVNGGTKL
ncbi:SDR family NAD(P)-dependent oxidoreductase [Flagellimonas lutimaris]|uniref:SDR family NAD(P)-dependent oxidoreductase n=1 Tax=Flagellimonas lutimaris TaxID=475082 RepID=UPI003F5CD0C2